MKNKKIVFAIPSMSGGGAERVVSILANSFIEHNEVTIITITKNKSFYSLNENINHVSYDLQIPGNYKILRIFKQIISLPLIFIFYFKELNKIEADVNISFLYQTNIILSVIKLFSKNMTLIISERNDPFARNKLLNIIINMLYKFPDAIVCQSSAVMDYFLKETNNYTTVIPNPLDLDLFPKYNENIIRENKIVAIGRLFPQKNYPMLINAFNMFNETISDYTLHIIGDGPEKKELIELVKNLNLTEKVIFEGAKKDFFKDIKNYKLYIMTSSYEGFPNSLVEAMAIGLPVISTDFATGVSRDLIGPNNGKVVQINDIESLSKSMIEIVTDDEKIKSMSKNNHKIINVLAKDKIVEKWNTLIISLESRD